MADLITKAKKEIEVLKMKKEKGFNKAAVEKYGGKAIKELEQKLKTYEKNYKKLTSKDEEYKALASFEPYYKKTKYTFLACNKIIDSIITKSDTTIKKLEEQNKKILPPEHIAKNKKATEALKKHIAELNDSKKCIETTLSNLKIMRKYEKNIVSNDSMSVAPIFFKNKLNTIKKNITLMAKGDISKYSQTIEKIISLSSSLDRLNQATQSSSNKINKEEWRNGRDEFWKIVEKAEKLQATQKEKQIETTAKSHDATRSVSSVIPTISSQIKPATTKSVSASFKIGLLHTYYIKMHEFAEECFSGVQKIKKATSKYTDSALKKGLKIAAELLPGLIGLAAGITGVFSVAAIATISAISWIICQAAYSARELSDAVEKFSLGEEQSGNLTEALAELQKILDPNP